MLEQGTKLGPYQILHCVGAGGMGEVYRARDTRLDRIVALKVLPSEFSSDPLLRARLEREARTISQLSHPNICVLHDIGESPVDRIVDGESATEQVRYLVMEYVEGETLVGRLARGPLPLDQVLRYGAEIAAALDKAHRHGVIHRDVKPGNVMITKSGVKLLDFGIAKHREKAAPDVNARTESIRLTGEGAVLGTFQYMAPEQLAALGADARTDIFALGSILYEMTTGRPAFEGATRTSVIAAILSGQPRPMGELQPITPPALEHVVRRCLEKEPDDRWQSAHDVKVELDWIAQGGSLAGAQSPAMRRQKLRFRAVVGLTALLGVLLAAALGGLLLRNRTVPNVVADLVPQAGQRYVPAGNSGGPAVISPDGNWVVYSAQSGDKRSLWIRSIANGKARLLPDTENAIFPFWSPDSRRVAFFGRDNNLRRIDIDGDVSLAIAPAPNGRGGTWNAHGTILFAPDVQAGLFVVPDRGGTATQLTKPGANQSTHRWPAFLPDGTHFVYFAADHRDPSGKSSGVFVASLEDPTPHLVLRNASNALYADGRLLFARDGVLYAQKMSMDGELQGDPAIVARDVMFDGDVWRSGFSAADGGRLVYHPGSVQIVSELLWLDRAGATTATLGRPEKYWEVTLSPDGRTAALSAGDPLRQLWIEDLVRHTRSRVTLDFGWTGGPIWSHDGGSLYFTALEGTTSTIVRRRLSDGSQAKLMRSEGLAWPAAISTDERTLIVNDESKGDLLRLRIGSNAPEPFLADPEAREIDAVGSADARWIAYASDESGKAEIYVVAVDDPLTKHQVSTDGGSHPQWRPDDRELYYMSASGELMAVSVSRDAADLAFGAPQRLFKLTTNIGMSTARAYAPSADGTRFLVIRPLDPGEPRLRLMTNWRAAD